VSDEILELVDLFLGHSCEMSQSGHPIKIIIRFSVRIRKVIMRDSVFLIIPSSVFDDRRSCELLSDPVRRYMVVGDLVDGREEDGLTLEERHESCLNILFQLTVIPYRLREMFILN